MIKYHDDWGDATAAHPRAMHQVSPFILHASRGSIKRQHLALSRRKALGGGAGEGGRGVVTADERAAYEDFGHAAVPRQLHEIVLDLVAVLSRLQVH